MLKQVLIASLVAGVSSVALAGPVTVKVGGSVLAPTTDSKIQGDVATYNGKTMKAATEVNFTPSIEVAFGDLPLSAELLLATPFDQDVKVDGANAASLKHLPPTLTFKYNLKNSTGFTPYVGVGATVFIPWEAELSNGTKLDVSTEVAPAAQLGFNFKPADAKNWGVFADVRYAHLKPTVKVDANNAKVTDLEINPVVYTVGYSYNF